LITPALAAELLADCCPSFAASPWGRDIPPTDDPEAAAHLRLIALALHCHDLVRDGRGDEAAAVFGEVERLLAEAPRETGDAIAVAFVEGVLCVTSHRGDRAEREQLLGQLGPLAWQRWHQGHERAEALSARRGGGLGRADLLRAPDPWVQGLARATSFRAENGRLVSLAERAGVARPVRHPVLTQPAVWLGVLFLFVLLLALWRIFG
jgi:hypothetical protein